MATNKTYISAGASPTNLSSETPTNNTTYIAAGVSPIYVDDTPVASSIVPIIMNEMDQFSGGSMTC